MLTIEKAKNYIVSRNMSIGNATGAPGATLINEAILDFGGPGLDQLTIQISSEDPATTFGLPSNGSNEKFFKMDGRDVLEIDFDLGAENIARFYFVFPMGDIDCFYFYFSESATGTNDLASLADVDSNLSIQVDTGYLVSNITIYGDPPIGGPGPKT